MKLNPDCIRDILLEVERVCDFRTRFRYPEDGTNLEKYDPGEVLYHIKQCELSGFISEVNWFMRGSCMVRDLAPEGHQFLANIRNDNNWNAVKETAGKVGSFSLDALKSIAIGVVTSLINKQIGS